MTCLRRTYILPGTNVLQADPASGRQLRHNLGTSIVLLGGRVLRRPHLEKEETSAVAVAGLFHSPLRKGLSRKASRLNDPRYLVRAATYAIP
jgi:hypothetical protein